jgi:hypothetical protein
MAKKIASQKAQAPAVVEIQAPAPTETDTSSVREAAVSPVKAPVDPVAVLHAKWLRRLNRWAGKVQAAGLDPKKLMQEVMEG